MPAPNRHRPLLRPTAASPDVSSLRPAPVERDEADQRDGRRATRAADAAAPAAQNRPSAWRRLRLGFKIGVPLGVVALVFAEHRLVGSSLRVLGHLDWVWLVVAVELESASIAMLARLQRRLLRAGNARVGLWKLLGTTYAANAISVSVPLAGAQFSVAYVFRRFKRLGVDPTLAGWALLVSGLISSLASATILAIGAVVSGNDVAALTGAVFGFVSACVIVAGSLAIRHPRFEKVLERPVVRILQGLHRVTHRPSGSAHGQFRNAVDCLRALHLRRPDWAMVVGLAFGNWLADAGVLAASLFAVGAGVPWHGLLFAYGAGATVGSLRLTPGGLGVVEGTLTVALMGVGVHHGSALPAVLLYRIVSFWMVSSVGWLVYLVGRRGASAT